MNGWGCSHVLACMHCDDILNLEWLISNLSARRKAGRPRDRLPALMRAKMTGEIDISCLAPEKWWFVDICRDVNGIIINTKIKSLIITSIFFRQPTWHDYWPQNQAGF